MSFIAPVLGGVARFVVGSADDVAVDIGIAGAGGAFGTGGNPADASVGAGGASGGIVTPKPTSPPRNKPAGQGGKGNARRDSPDTALLCAIACAVCCVLLGLAASVASLMMM